MATSRVGKRRELPGPVQGRRRCPVPPERLNNVRSFPSRCCPAGHADPVPVCRTVVALSAVYRGTTRFRHSGTGFPLAAVRSQKIHQPSHRTHVGTVAQKTAFPLLGDQAAAVQLFEMEGQAVCRERQGVGNPLGMQALRACSDKETEYPQSRRLCQGGQRPERPVLAARERAAVHVAALPPSGKPVGNLRVISQQMSSISAEPSSA